MAAVATAIAAIEGCDDPTTTVTWTTNPGRTPTMSPRATAASCTATMVMMMYAWSPNWKSNSVGNDHYNLYQRRSFDGGVTWTTTPADWCDCQRRTAAMALEALEYYYGETTGEFVPGALGLRRW